MKLLFCLSCQDVIKLIRGSHRSCLCGETRGRYVDDVNAVYYGEHAIPLGFANGSFARAIRSRPEQGAGERFDAFVIPLECDTFRKG